MALSSGLGHTTGIVEETTFGVAPSLVGIRGYEVDSNTLTPKKTTVQGTGLRGVGFLPRETRRSIVGVETGGDIVMDLTTKGAGRLLKQCLGGSTIAQNAATTAFTQTFALADRRGRSMTIQSGIPNAAGTVVPFTHMGCKVTSWEIGLDNQGLLKISMTIDGREGVTSVAYVVPDYALSAPANLFSFAQGSALLGGVAPTGIRSFSIKGTEPLKTDRYVLGGLGKKSEQVNNGWWDLTATIETEFVTQTEFVDRFLNDASFQLYFLFEGAQIGSSGFTEKLAITMPTVKIDGELPSIGGGDFVEHTITCKVVDNGVNPPITIQYVSSDTVA